MREREKMIERFWYGLIVVTLLGGLAASVAIIYVAIHFIRKFW